MNVPLPHIAHITTVRKPTLQPGRHKRLIGGGQMKRVLIVDALNMYFRAYIVDPSLSSNGQPIGGVMGFLKILQKQIRDSKPDRIVIAWDGPGGSRKRKQMDKNYKAGRKPIRLNRSIRNLSESEEIDNKIWQQTRLVEYLNQMPVSQLLLPDIEADDVIAYATNLPYFDGWQKVIVSSDKDFFQLCDDETVVYRPIQKQVMNKKRIIEDFNIHPNNMALARAIAGDVSDNLPGIKGVGLPTIKKRLPFLCEEKSYTIDEVVDFCDNIDSNLKVYSSIIENEDVIEHNYKMMQLYSPALSYNAKQQVKFAIEEADQLFSLTEMKKMMIKDGFGTWDWSDLIQIMRRITVEKD
jgi:5'-3' exonuclease